MTDAFAIASIDVPWTACLVSDKTDMPTQWGEFVGDDVLKLKDTRHKYWVNRLVRPNKFIYLFPRESRRTWEIDLVSKIRTRVASSTPLLVELFSTPGSRNEYYGQWVVGELRIHGGSSHASELELFRLRNQGVTRDSVYGDSYEASASKRFRSHNEENHSRHLADIFPGDAWTVKHEPETLLDIHEPSVVNGEAKTVTTMSRSYTCDFVVCSHKGCHRFCVESKPTAMHVTAEALAKCRVLRDRTLTRVIFMVGVDDDIKFLDMGTLGAPLEVWYEDSNALKCGLGLMSHTFPHSTS